MQVPQDRWTLINHCVAHWHRPLEQNDGLPLDEIREAESWFDSPFPLGLQEWYLLAGRRSDLNEAQNYLLSPADLEVSDEHLVFSLENQGAVRWGILLSDLGLADPPVYLDNDFSVPTVPPSHSWILENTTLSAFLLQMIMLHTIIREPPSQEHFSGCAEIDASRMERIATLFPRLDFPLWHWPVSPTQYFGTDEILLLVDGALWLWVIAQSAPALKQLEESVPVTWIDLEGPFPLLQKMSSFLLSFVHLVSTMHEGLACGAGESQPYRTSSV